MLITNEERFKAYKIVDELSSKWSPTQIANMIGIALPYVAYIMCKSDKAPSSAVQTVIEFGYVR